MFLTRINTPKVLIIFICALYLAILPGAQNAMANSIKLFGTVELRSGMEKSTGWLSVLERQKNSDFFSTGARWRGSYSDFKKSVATKDPKGQLAMVNSYWNQYPYQTDMQVYGKSDYWAIPDQFIKNSGDCEDYAIAKYFTLRDIGYSADNLRIVVLRDTIRGYTHAVLVVYTDGTAYVLDNLTNSIFPHTQYKNYAPQFSVNEKWRWVHIPPKN